VIYNTNGKDVKLSEGEPTTGDDDEVEEDDEASLITAGVVDGADGSAIVTASDDDDDDEEVSVAIGVDTDAAVLTCADVDVDGVDEVGVAMTGVIGKGVLIGLEGGVRFNSIWGFNADFVSTTISSPSLVSPLASSLLGGAAPSSVSTSNSSTLFVAIKGVSS
jgi:hypothetical protein